MAKVFFITSEGMGRGDDRLGKLLMANFLRLLGENDARPESLVFMNSGVRLVCEGSDVLEHVRKLEEKGVEILACTTCLEYFELTDKLRAGRPTTMLRSVEAMLSREAVCL